MRERATRFRAPRAKARLVALLLLPLASGAQAQTSDDAFDGILTKLAELRQEVIDRTPGGDGDLRADGYRQILRQLSQGIETFTDDHDSAHPKLLRCPSINCKLGQDNPDNSYLLLQPLSDQYTYRIFGNRNDQLTLFQLRSNLNLDEGTLNTEEMVFDSLGNFEILLSPTMQPGNWMQTGPNTAQFLIRTYWQDWPTDVEPTISVEVLGDADGNPVPTLTPASFAAKAADLELWLDLFPFFVSRPDTFPVNDVQAPIPAGPFGNPDIVNARGRYDLQPSEALVIERPVTNAEYTGIQLGSLWWASLDYASRQTSLNDDQAYVDPDNVIRYVIAQSDPGVPNWLDASGHPQGTIHMRWVVPDPLDPPVQATAQVVPLANLASVLPAGHPTVTPAQRNAGVQDRQLSYYRRLNPPGSVFVPACGFGPELALLLPLLWLRERRGAGSRA